ncbi:MAG: ribosome maturation factor RimM [Saprospiraceae bacterium]
MDNLISVGYTKKSHGLKGDLKVQIEEVFIEDFLQAETVFLEIKGKKVPFFIEMVRDGNEMLVKFEEVDSREVADTLTGKELFMREADIDLSEAEDDDDTEEDFTEYIGFTIHDTELGVIGTIEDIIEYPQHSVAVLTYQHREVLIPMNAAFIRDIQPNAKILIMELPEGLLEL